MLSVHKVKIKMPAGMNSFSVSLAAAVVAAAAAGNSLLSSLSLLTEFGSMLL